MAGTGQQYPARRDRFKILVHAEIEELEAAWQKVLEPPGYQLLRGPETGLTMIEARAGGTGRRFNLGEMTVTRCSLQMDNGYAGHSYVAGRSPRKAELVAAFDALFQDPAQLEKLGDMILTPLKAAREERTSAQACKTAATRVEFFTMVRGDE